MQLDQSKLYVVTFQPSGSYLNLDWKVFTTKREAERAMRKEQREFLAEEECFNVTRLLAAILDAQTIAQEIGKELGRKSRRSKKKKLNGYQQF